MSLLASRLPNVTVRVPDVNAIDANCQMGGVTRQGSGPEPGPEPLGRAVSTAVLFGSGVHVVFGVLGAFSPQCDQTHLPGYVSHSEAFKAAGVDGIWCLSVNDPFVMEAWFQARHAKDKVWWISDGSADFSRAIGVSVCLNALGMGTRCRRFAMLIRDGQVLHLSLELPGQLHVSAAPYMLDAVKSLIG
jgi:peroxiredoxin (alkyl hydroperoxide reductase subunit C)